jgi:hypothetical protein
MQEAAAAKLNGLFEEKEKKLSLQEKANNRG